MSETQQTCAELVESKMWDRSAQIEDLLKVLRSSDYDYDKSEEAREELDNLALEVSVYKVIKVLLSTGGPADWIEIKVNNDDEILGMTYHYQDWFDHAQIKLTEDSYLWDYAMEIVEITNTEG